MHTRLASLLGALSVAAVCTQVAQAQVVIAPGEDGWSTPESGSTRGTIVDFSGSPIPAGFLARLDPFSGVTAVRRAYRHVSSGPPARRHLVRRPVATLPIPIGGQDTVPIEIVSLSLVSCEPITVTFNAGTSSDLWNVRAHVSTIATSPPGSITIRLQHGDGGTFDSVLPVVPRLMFERNGGGANAVIDPAPMLQFQSQRSGWSLVGRANNFNPPSFGIHRAAGRPGRRQRRRIARRSRTRSSNFVPGIGWNGCH